MLEAVHKRLEAEETREYEAESEEATEIRTQQACILSGRVYSRHRLEKPASKNLLALLLLQRYYSLGDQDVMTCGVRRAGVLACKKLSPLST